MSSVANRATGATDTRDYFFTLATAMRDLVAGDEVFTCELRGEDSTFIRFNHGRVGQAGRVRQLQIEVDLIAGRRHAIGTVSLSGEADADLTRLRDLFGHLRGVASATEEDPFLSYNTDPDASSERTASAVLPAGGEVVAVVAQHAGNRDLVGIYAGGDLQRGFANSLGQMNWHSAQSFHFDWSLFDRHGRAAKASYAGVEWCEEALVHRMAMAREDVARLSQPGRILRPGMYRVYLAPAAVAEIMSILAWDGFGLRGKMTRSSPLLRLHRGDAVLATNIHLTEDIAAGAAPAFERAGFPRPDRVALIQGGRYAASLASPRSAIEFGAESNGADGDEVPQSLDMAGGELDAEHIAASLHTGLLVSNLWYLNFSERASCRATGMTRFATLWVEDGRVQGPVDAMRFDESIYRILGTKLVGLTRQRDWIADPDTYGWRSCRTARLPGVLVDDVAFTL
jgi:predicted Zn-dependent protease